MAVRHVFNPRHMKSGMYTEGIGQQKMNSRGANNIGDRERANKAGGKFAGFQPEGQVLSGQLGTMPVRWRSACRRYV